MQSVRRGILTLAVIVTIPIILTAPTFAQTTPRLERLHVDLWPEYDRADMLIIYRGTLSADTPLPATLTLHLPAQIEEPHAVAYVNEEGELINANYSTATTSDNLAVTLETPTPNFQLEFYDRLDQTGERRSYTFLWSGDYPVDQLSLLLLPPTSATQVSTEPALSPVQGQDGSTSSYAGTLGSLPAGQEARLILSYQSGPKDTDTSLRFIAGGGIIVALALVILSRMWYTRRLASQAVQAPPPRRRFKSSRSQRRGQQSHSAPSKTGVAAYCTNCGRPLHEDDRFCGHCGAVAKGTNR